MSTSPSRWSRRAPARPRLARRPSASFYSGEDGRLRLEGFDVVDVVESHVIAQLRDPLNPGTFFANNQIPSSRFNPIAVKMIQRGSFPAPTPGLTGTSNILVNNPIPQNVNQYSVRIDHQLSQQTGLFGRFSVFKVHVFQPFGTGQLNESLIPGFGRGVGTKTYNAAFSYSHFFSTAVLNEFRFGYLDVSGGQTSPNQGDNFAARTDLLGVNPDPRDVG